MHEPLMKPCEIDATLLVHYGIGMDTPSYVNSIYCSVMSLPSLWSTLVWSALCFYPLFLFILCHIQWSNHHSYRDDV